MRYWKGHGTNRVDKVREITLFPYNSQFTTRLYVYDKSYFRLIITKQRDLLAL